MQKFSPGTSLCKMRILFRAGDDLRKWASNLLLQMGRLRLQEAAGSRTRSCIQAFPASGRCARARGDPHMGNGFCSNLGAESGFKGPWDHLRGFGRRDNGSKGCWAQVRPWGGLLYWREGGSGVSGGEKGAVAAPSCREVNQEGKKQEGGKKS